MVFPIVFFAVQFIFVKEFQNRAGCGINQGLFMNMVAGGGAFVALFAFKQFSLFFTLKNVILAFLVGLCIVTLKTLLVKAVSMGMVSISTMFYVMGGTLIPFIFGISFLHEKLSIFKTIGILLAFLSFFPTIRSCEINESGKKASIKFIVICFLIFLANGTSGVFVKINQIASIQDHTIDFIALYSFFIFLISIIALVIQKARCDDKEFFRMFRMNNAASALKVSICNTTANVFVLNLAKKLPASVQFPVTMIGVVILTTILSMIILKEFPTRKILSSLSLVVLAIVFLVI
jgi:drug/metabolite transporter (DMT)-like permease